MFTPENRWHVAVQLFRMTRKWQTEFIVTNIVLAIK